MKDDLNNETASGIGLAVAQSLSKRPGWDIHILDRNADLGQQTASSLGASAEFHESNVTNYEQLRFTFQSIFSRKNRIDFVFANAGIAEHDNFYEEQPNQPPYPKGLDPLVDINVKSVITTSYLALHHFRKSPRNTDKSLVITASCGGLYPTYYAPIYTSSKHAVIGFARAINPQFFATAGVRVNTICPGAVKTPLLSDEEWGTFPDPNFTPVEKIAEVVLMLLDGKDEQKGQDQGVLRGKAIEVSGTNHYYRDSVEFCDESMRAVMGSTDIESLDAAK